MGQRQSPFAHMVSSERGVGSLYAVGGKRRVITVTLGIERVKSGQDFVSGVG